jgi:hypothetical protein
MENWNQKKLTWLRRLLITRGGFSKAEVEKILGVIQSHLKAYRVKSERIEKVKNFFKEVLIPGAELEELVVWVKRAIDQGIITTKESYAEAVMDFYDHKKNWRPCFSREDFLVTPRSLPARSNLPRDVLSPILRTNVWRNRGIKMIGTELFRLFVKVLKESGRQPKWKSR